MANADVSVPDIEFRPLDLSRWADLETVFGSRGACAGCWCMWWRLTGSEFEQSRGYKNRASLHRIVQSGNPPGILAYVRNKPAGWCAIAPRSDYPRLARSRVLKPVDDQPVWSVTCFFVSRAYRRQGLMISLLQAAVDYACARGARIIEGYPVEPRSAKMPDMDAYTGVASIFRKAGFVEVARRSAGRPIMRYTC